MSGVPHLIDNPARFLKCPSCHRRGGTSLTICPDGDVQLKCRACGALALGEKLNQSDRTYE